MKTLPQDLNKDWEKEFDEKFSAIEPNEFPNPELAEIIIGALKPYNQDVKSFIKLLLSQRDRELVEAVEGLVMPDEPINDIPNDYKEGFEAGYYGAKDDILTLLKR